MPSHPPGTAVPSFSRPPLHRFSTGQGDDTQPTQRQRPWCLSLVMAGCLIGAAPALWAQKPAPSAPLSSSAPQVQAPPLSWPQANESVGQYLRGHLDLLRWEQQNLPAQPQERAPATGQPALTLSKALTLALQDQPQWVLRPGMSGPEQAELHTRLQSRVLQVQRAWTAAVADTQAAQYSRQVLSAAEAGAELAQRMARLGNWSRARQMQEELLLWDARAGLQNAELQALQSVQALWQLVGQHLSVSALTEALPVLPELPTQPLGTLDALEQQALAAHPQWTNAQMHAARLVQAQSASSLALMRQSLAQAAPLYSEGTVAAARLSASTPWSHSAEKALEAQLEADALERQIRADVRVAHAAYQMARQQAAHSRSEVQRLYTALEQESLLRYNGMLKSTWDLLASARQRIQSVNAAHQAQRQAWLAWADLQAVLNGLPYTGSPGASRGTSTPSPAGH